MLNLRFSPGPAHLAAFVGLATACVPEVDDNLSFVDAPRILAVRATPAEISTEKTTAIEALVAAPDGAAVPEINWQMCLERKPLTELGPVNPACLDFIVGGDETRVPLGTGQTADVTTVREACRLFGPIAPPPEGGMKGGRPVDPDATGGFYQPVVAFLGGEPTLGMVRLDCGLPLAPREALIEYNSLHKPNGNPALSLLSLSDGSASTVLEPGSGPASAAVPLGLTVTLRAEWQQCPREAVCEDDICSEGEDLTSCAADCTTPLSCAGSETYHWYDPGTRQVTPRRESILVAWYATGGDFTERQTGVLEADPDSSTTETQWVAPSAAGEVKLWVVLRDDRGGSSWQEYRVNVE
jgi:hypothetical protein